MEYLTDQDYEIAEKNGINRKNAWQRFYEYGWDKEKTLYTPLRKASKQWKEWVKVAEKNGISEPAFRNRMNYKWTPEEAATFPIGIRRTEK